MGPQVRGSTRRTRAEHPTSAFRPGQLHHLHVALEPPAPRRMTQLPERLGFDLSYALARHVEGGADLFQRPRASVVGQTEPKPDHLRLALAQGLQHLVHLVLEHRERGRLGRRDHAGVLDEISEVRIVVLADGTIQRDRLLRRLEHALDLVHRQLELLGDLLGRGLPSQFLHQPPRRAHDLVDRLDHVHRHADRARLVGDGARDGLTDPPRGVGRELVALPVVELVDRAHQTGIAFLDQVEEFQAAVGVALGDRDHETHVRLDHLALRLVAGDLAGADLGVHFADLLAGQLAVDLHLADLAAAVLLGLLEVGQELQRELRLLLDVLGVLPALPRALQERHELLGRPPVPALEYPDLQLRLAQIQGKLLHAGREPLDQPRVEIERVEVSQELLVRVAKLLHVAPALLLRGPRHGLFLQFHQLHVELPHALHGLERPRPLALRRVLGIPVSEIDLEKILHAHLALLELDAHGKELLDDGRGAEKSGADLALAGLDALGDLDLPFAVEERDAPHLAQVHAHGVVVAHRVLEKLLLLRLLLLAALQLELLLRLLVAVEHIDLEVVERDVDLVHVLHRGALVEERLDLVVEQVLLLASKTLQFLKTVRLHPLHSVVSPFPVFPWPRRPDFSSYLPSMQDHSIWRLCGPIRRSTLPAKGRPLPVLPGSAPHGSPAS